MIVIAGTSNPKLAQKVSQLSQSQLAQIQISKFPNGEKRILVETSIKNETVVIIQSFSKPVDENIIEFCLIADAASQAGAKRIVGVVPWLGYSPQDKVFRQGEPVSLHVMAKIIKTCGVTDLVTVDIHSRESLKYFDIPTVEITALPLFVSFLKQRDLSDSVVVSIDEGSRHRSNELAKMLDLPLCSFNKTRDRHTGEVQFEHVSGEVEGKKAISFDDFISTGSTQIGACAQLKDMGLKEYTACVTHAVFAGSDTSHKLHESQIDQIITTDTYPVPAHSDFLKLKTLSCVQLLSDYLTENFSN